MAPPMAPSRCRTSGNRPVGRGPASKVSALVRRRRSLTLSPARAALLASMVLFVDSSPGPSLRLLFGNTTLLVAFFNVLGLTLLSFAVAGFVAAPHRLPPSSCNDQ